MIKGVDLSIEITRRCNMNCSHCLRGDAQNKTMSQRVINQIANVFTDINTLIISGGEPSLVPFVIKKIARSLNYDNWYMVTNGNFKLIEEPNLKDKIYSEDIYNSYSKFIGAVYLLERYSLSRGVSSLALSCDTYHDDLGNMAKDKLNVLKDILMPEKISISNHSGHYKTRNILGIGNGTNYSDEILFGRDYGCPIGSDSEYIEDEDWFSGTYLYVNVRGKVFFCSNLSYELQENKELCLGSIFKPEELKKNIIGWINNNRKIYEKENENE